MAQSNQPAPFPDTISYGEKYGPAMEIRDQADADVYFDRCVEHLMRRRPEMSRTDAERIERGNLGYFAGYYNAETMERVNRLFRTTHPVFGGTAPIAEEAFKAGRRMAEKRMAGKSSDGDGHAD